MSASPFVRPVLQAPVKEHLEFSNLYMLQSSREMNGYRSCCKFDCFVLSVLCFLLFCIFKLQVRTSHLFPMG